MKKKDKFILVDSSVLPEVYSKVIAVKKLLSSGTAKTVNQAAEDIGISRSAFYKYKDYVFPFYEMNKERIITLFFVLLDLPGVLSEILNLLAVAGANILTINQNIPINGVANITISVQTGNITVKIEELIESLQELNGVKEIEVLARE